MIPRRQGIGGGPPARRPVLGLDPSERAVTYRLPNGVDQRQAQTALIVQQMVFPEASGVEFPVDPVTSNRKFVSLEATFGLARAPSAHPVPAMKAGHPALNKLPVHF